MARPNLTFNLLKGSVVLDITEYLDSGSSCQITTSIESPFQTNTFNAGEVGLKGFDDRAGTIRAWFASLTIATMDFQAQIWNDSGKIFDGFILPNTVQFDDKVFSFAFTVVGIGARLARTDAAIISQFIRSAVGWTVSADYVAGATQLLVTGSGACPFGGGDTISMDSAGVGATALVIGTMPPDSGITTLFIEALNSGFLAGTPITLVNFYRHNVQLKEAVDGTLVAAGLQATTNETFNALLFSSTEIFASPMTTEGISATGGSPSRMGIAGPRYTGGGKIVGVTTPDHAYTMASPPTGPWNDIGATVGFGVVDWTPYGMSKTYFLNGLRSKKRTVAAPFGFFVGQCIEYRFYAYDYTSDSPTATQHRYNLQVIIDNSWGTFAEYNFVAKLNYETATDGATWGGETNLATVAGSPTSTRLHDYMAKCFGIDIDVVHGVLFYSSLEVLTDLTSSFYVSSWKIGGAENVNVAAVRGVPVCYALGYVGVFDVDPLNGNVPHGSIYGTTTSGAGLTSYGQVGLPDGFQSLSIRANYGDSAGGNVLYALACSAKSGVSLIKFDSVLLASSTAAKQLVGSNSANQMGQLLVIDPPDTSVPGTWPMMALIGSQPWWISKNFSGVVPYFDLSSINCGDALGQLATLVNGFFYIDNNGASWFRTRSALSGRTIARPGTSDTDVFDDDGLITMASAPQYSDTYVFISVTNDQNSAIFGEAGDAGARNGTFALSISNRFVTSVSHAAGIAATILSYLGQNLPSIDATHTDDGRRYELGYTFHASINGVSKRFQIVGTGRDPKACTVTVQAVGI